MDTIELTTQGGYKATIKKDLTYGEYSNIQNTIMGKMTFDPTGASQMSGAFMTELSKLARQFLLVSLKDKEGQDIDIDNIPSRDGLEIETTVNDVYLKAAPAKKN